MSQDRSDLYVELRERLFEAVEAGDHRLVLEIVAFVDAACGDDSLDFDEPVPEMADVLEVVSGVLVNLGEHGRALALGRQALAIREVALGAEHPLVSASLEHLSALYQEVGNAREADAAAKRSREVLSAHLDRVHAEFVRLHAEARYADAIPLAEEICLLTQRLSGGEHPEYAQALNNLGYLYKQIAFEFEQPRYYPIALELYRKALDVWSRSHGETHVEFAMGLQNLAELQRVTGDDAEAEFNLQKALEVFRDRLGARSPEVAGALNNLARLHQDTGGLSHAEELHREALEIRKEALGGHHPLVAQSLNNLASVLEDQGRLREAEPLFYAAVEILQETLPPNHPELLRTSTNLLQLYEKMGNSDAREAHFRRLLGSLEAVTRERPFELHPLPELTPVFQELERGLGGAPPAATAGEGEDGGSPAFQAAVQGFVSDFVAQKYSSCFREAIRLNARSSTLEIVLLYLASIQLLAGPLGRDPTDPMNAMGEVFLAGTTSNPWSHTLVRLILGRAEASELLPQAREAALACQVHFYAALRLAVEGRREEAREHVRACLGADVNSLERRVADEMQDVPPAPPRDRSAGARIHQLNARVSELLRQRRHTEASGLASEAFALAHEHLPDGSAQFRESVYNLASTHYLAADYTAAKRFYEQLVELLRGDARPDPLTLASGLNGLGLVHIELGRYADAEPLLREAIEILDSAGMSEHETFAQVCGNLAELFRERHDYTAAIPLYEQALDSLNDKGDAARVEYARWLKNLGILYLEAGYYGEAEDLMRQSQDIREALLPADHPDLAVGLGVLSQLYLQQSRFDDAERALERSTAIYRAVFGDADPRVATSMNNLSVLHLRRGELARASETLEDAWRILETSLPSGHPSIAALLSNRGILRAAGGDVSEAVALLEQAIALRESLRSELFAVSSERQRMLLLQDAHASYSAFLSLSRTAVAFPGIARKAWDVVLRYQAVESEAQSAQRMEILKGRYADLRPRLEALIELRRKIARKILSGPGPEGAQAHASLLLEWTREREQLEAELARKIPEADPFRRLEGTGVDGVVEALPPESALVHFVRYNDLDFARLGDPDGARTSARYAAFVVSPSQSTGKTVQLIDLGEAGLIDDEVVRLRGFLAREPHARAGSGRHIFPPGVHAGADEGGDRLRACVFDVLLSSLGGVRRLFVVPDGELTRLPLEVLPGEDGKRLVETYALSYLSSPREILRLGVRSGEQPGEALVVADPDYDLSNLEPRTYLVREDRVSRDLKRGGMHFTSLPGARREGREVAKLLGVHVLQGAAALEGCLKKARSPVVLHIATHGFFLPNQNPGSGGIIEAMEMDRMAALASIENPMLRSGLALAGANAWMQGQPLPEEAEDGLLTAEDVTAMDLLDTELVVLSACDTGLGDVHVGEGVLGLRRAFAIAGAKTLVMSLWKVPDDQTQDLMWHFYSFMRAGKSRAEALRQAQLAIKGEHPDPFYWGAFICQGEPGPLPGLATAEDLA